MGAGMLGHNSKSFYQVNIRSIKAITIPQKYKVNKRKRYSGDQNRRCKEKKTNHGMPRALLVFPFIIRGNRQKIQSVLM